MADLTATPVLSNFSQQAVLRAALATDFRSFVQYVFGVLRPGIEFRPNWHIDAMAYKLSQVATVPLLSFGPSAIVSGSAYLLSPPFGMECLTSLADDMAHYALC